MEKRGTTQVSIDAFHWKDEVTDVTGRRGVVQPLESPDKATVNYGGSMVSYSRAEVPKLIAQHHPREV